MLVGARWAPPLTTLRRVDLPTAAGAVVLAAFVGYYALCCFGIEWGGDFQRYVAGVAALYRDFLDPGHEALPVATQLTVVYTPYLVAVGGVGRLLGVTPYRALQLAGVVNVGVLAAAMIFFVSRFSRLGHTLLSAGCLLLATLLLRWNHFGWSGEISLLGLPFLPAYPSTLAWGLALFSFGLMRGFGEGRNLRIFLGLVALLTAQLLTHLITASWTIGIAGLWAGWRLVVDRDWRTSLAMGGTIVAAFVLSLPWPYASFFGQIPIVSVNEGAAFGEQPLEDFRNLYLVAFPLGIWLFVRIRGYGFVAVAFGATFGALELWKALGVSYGDRYSFFMAFWACFVVGEAVAAGFLSLVGRFGRVEAVLMPGRLWPWLDRGVATLAVPAAAVAVAVSPVWERAIGDPYVRLRSPLELLETASPHDRFQQRLKGMRDLLDEGDVVLAAIAHLGFDLAVLTGAKVVAIKYADAVPDAARRSGDVAAFFKPGAAEDVRIEVVRRRCATKILLTQREAILEPEMASLFGTPIYRDQRYALFDATRAPGVLEASGPCADRRGGCAGCETDHGFR